MTPNHTLTAPEASTPRTSHQAITTSPHSITTRQLIERAHLCIMIRRSLAPAGAGADLRSPNPALLILNRGAGC